MITTAHVTGLVAGVALTIIGGLLVRWSERKAEALHEVAGPSPDPFTISPEEFDEAMQKAAADLVREVEPTVVQMVHLDDALTPVELLPTLSARRYWTQWLSHQSSTIRFFGDEEGPRNVR